MANKDYIQEYLIGLGFDVPPEKLRKFREGAAVAAKEVAELGGAAIATASAIGYMTTQAARQFEGLYYQSQRTGVSVTRLKAFEFASRQVGVAAEEASSATEAMFATMRTNPGMQGLASALGVNAGGNSLDNTIRIVRLVPTEWVLCDISIHAVHGGFGHGAMRLFAQDGTLMATASQSVIVRVHEQRGEGEKG